MGSSFATDKSNDVSRPVLRDRSIWPKLSRQVGSEPVCKPRFGDLLALLMPDPDTGVPHIYNHGVRKKLG